MAKWYLEVAVTGTHTEIVEAESYAEAVLTIGNTVYLRREMTVEAVFVSEIIECREVDEEED